jgi:hypothetical protein
MPVLVFIIWIVSLVLLAIAAFYPRPWPQPHSFFAAGVFALDLWLGLQFLIEASDPIRF